MGCFLECFGSSKEEKRRNQRKHKVLLRNQRYGSPNFRQHRPLSTEKDISAEPLNLATDLPDEVEEELSLITREDVITNINLQDGIVEEQSLITKKKVTFDTNVKTYEPVTVNKSTEHLLSETKGNTEDQKYSSGNSISLSNPHSEDDSFTSNVGSYPPNHRYQNCRDSDDEIDEFMSEDSNLEDENDDSGEYSDCDCDGEVTNILDKKLWAESDPTASIESTNEIPSVFDAAEEVDSPLIVTNLAEKERKYTSYNGNPVLNPIKNIAQWKTEKSKTIPTLNSQKENFSKEQEESRLSFSFMSKSDKPMNQNQEISVDASLSNWLPSSKSTPVKKTNPEVKFGRISIEDRPILGALTVEEIKQFSATNSPRRSPSRSPDEMAIIGTVGRYWNSSGSTMDSNSASSYKGIPNSTSKYGEDKKVIWHSTPFESRLEKALKIADNEV